MEARGRMWGRVGRCGRRSSGLGRGILSRWPLLLGRTPVAQHAHTGRTLPVGWILVDTDGPDYRSLTDIPAALSADANLVDEAAPIRLWRLGTRSRGSTRSRFRFG